MPLPADIAPALRQLSVPLAALADAWPSLRAHGTSGRRLSVCPTPTPGLRADWVSTLRQMLDDCRQGAVTTLALPLAARLARTARRAKLRIAPQDVATQTPADQLPTVPWTAEPDSAAARSRREMLRIADDFDTVLDELPPHAKVDDLRARLRLCATPHELWHLRPDLFNLVAHLRSQVEAQRSLLQLDRHFPSRSL
jgi:hypothetical protein